MLNLNLVGLLEIVPWTNFGEEQLVVFLQTSSSNTFTESYLEYHAIFGNTT